MVDRKEMDYSQFKSLQFDALELPSGMLVRGVPVSALLTSRETLEPESLLGIASHFRYGRCIDPVSACRVLVKNQPYLGLVSDCDAHIIGAATFNRIGRVDVSLLPRQERPSGPSIVPIREIAEPFRTSLKLPRMAGQARIRDIHQTTDGGLALEFTGKRPYKAEVVSIAISDGGSTIYFVDQKGDVISARAPRDLMQKLPPEIISRLSIKLKG
ncbi:MAG: hypothetical protein Q7R82_00495 [Candidatus Daviesbacteria bacterium]|nr:hypothetical protein [Candidatus Daviesbacteria bacterium]